MRIIIKELDGIELINEEFSMINIDKNIFSITFSTTNILLKASLNEETFYNVTFLNAENFGLTGTMNMKYLTYHFSASTAYITNEEGNRVPTIQVNSNSLQLKKL